MHPFARAPFIVFWEMTQACDLACAHCRATARPHRSEWELDTEQGEALLDSIAEMGTPIVVLTGGDPAQREDLVRLVRHGTNRGLHMALTPSATPLLTEELIARLQDAGLARIAISLDGTDAATHDGFRGFPGTFEASLKMLRAARAAGLTTQVNTTVTPGNLHQLADFEELLTDLDVQLWAAFFVVPTGRAEAHAMLSAEACEQALEQLADIAERAPFDVKTTAAPHFRRHLIQRKVEKQLVKGVSDGIGRARRGVNDGSGVVFVSHVGHVYPSGFLPTHCGHVADPGGIAAIYTEHPTFLRLRDADKLGGKCGICAFRRVCGGSRARAFAVTGDYMAEDPTCAYQPLAPARGESAGRDRSMAETTEQRAPGYA